MWFEAGLGLRQETRIHFPVASVPYNAAAELAKYYVCRGEKHFFNNHGALKIDIDGYTSIDMRNQVFLR